MRIEFQESEIEALPDAVRRKLDNNVFEGEPSDIIEDVSGLKSALEKTREEKKDALKTQTNIREALGLDDKMDIIPAIQTLKSGADQSGAMKRELADERLTTAIAKADGNVAALPAVIRDRMEWSEVHGQYVVAAEDGEPVKNDDGSLRGVDSVISKMKADPNFGAFFRSTSSSGSGSPPQHGNDGPSGLHVDQDATVLPLYTTPRSQMTREQKVAIHKAGADFERWPL